MTSQTSLACPRCHAALTPGTRFCGHCGSDISGVWTAATSQGDAVPISLPGTPAPYSGPTIIEEPAQDALLQMLVDATLGDYDIYGELGRGGMAAVYLALDLALNRKVAIKTMLPDLVSREGMVQRFRREAQTAAALNHPHIIQIYTVRQSQQLVYFVMKYIEGRSLESVIAEHGHMPLDMTQTILGQVGSALAYAHRKGVVHRDIKPANIMIDEDGWAIVTDFGIAKVQEAQNLTATGTAIGTPHYMSPEQFHNKAVTGRSDQYSLGVVAFEMLTGRKPFSGSTYAEIITQHLFEPVPDVRTLQPGLPPHVADVLGKMLAKDPEERYPDLDVAIAALGAPASKTEGEVVRTQMISLAKAGPEKKVRMSVPVSPVPVQKRTGTVVASPSPAPAAAPAASEPAQAAHAAPKKATRPRPPVKRESGGKSRGLTIALVTLLVLAGLGFGAVRMKVIPFGGAKSPVGGDSSAVQQSGASVVQSQTPNVAAPAADSGIVPAGGASGAADTAQRPAAAIVPQPGPDSAARRASVVKDSIARVAFVKDSATHARAARDSVARARAARDSIARAERAERLRRDSITAAAKLPPPSPGSVKLASRTPGAALYINGSIDGLLNSPRDVKIPSNTSVRLSVRAPNCQPWDTVVTVAPGSSSTIGYRSAKCQ